MNERELVDELSIRAQSYVGSLTRRDAVRDDAEIRRLFREAEVPEFEPVIRFQQQFGGLEESYGHNLFVWGIVHSTPDPDSAFEPNRLDAFKEDDRWYFTCADCHMSDHWFLDQDGALYWCFDPPLASGFAKKIERDAVAWELALKERPRRIVFEKPDAEVVELLAPRLRPGLVEEASDQYESLYLHGGLYAAVKKSRIIAYACADFDAALLSDLSFRFLGDAPVEAAEASPRKPWWKFW